MIPNLEDDDENPYTQYNEQPPIPQAHYSEPQQPVPQQVQPQSLPEQTVIVAPEKKWYEKFFEGLSKVWAKTIFPDMIEQKKEEKAFKKQIMREAKLEAMTELKGAYKDKIKKDALDKLAGKKSGMMEKLAKGFSDVAKGSDQKLASMMGGTSGGNIGGNVAGNMGLGGNKGLGSDKGVGSDEHIRNMIGLQQPQQQPVQRQYRGPVRGKKKKKGKKYNRPQQPQQNKMESFEDKMKRMLR